MIDVSKEEFMRGFHKHYSMYQESNQSKDSKCLILFYAVECGLKGILMYRRNIHMYSKLNEEDKCGHDIKKLLKKIGIESRYSLSNFRTKHGDRVGTKQYHEVWRYGVDISKEDKNNQIDEQIEKELHNIAIWISENECRR